MSIEKVKKIFRKARDIMIISPSGKPIKKTVVDYRTSIIPIVGDIKILEDNINLKKMVGERDDTISKLERDKVELGKIIEGNIYKNELDIIKSYIEFHCLEQNRTTTIIQCKARIKRGLCKDTCKDLRYWLSY